MVILPLASSLCALSTSSDRTTFRVLTELGSSGGASQTSSTFAVLAEVVCTVNDSDTTGLLLGIFEDPTGPVRRVQAWQEGRLHARTMYYHGTHPITGLRLAVATRPRPEGAASGALLASSRHTCKKGVRHEVAPVACISLSIAAAVCGGFGP